MCTALQLEWASMASPTRTGNRSEKGFTLAGVIVLLTIVMIFAAYTVPRQWSAILQRDRDRQTLFIMKQYALAISRFQDRNKTWPVSMDQLKEARQPRFLRRGKPRMRPRHQFRWPPHSSSRPCPSWDLWPSWRLWP